MPEKGKMPCGKDGIPIHLKIHDRKGGRRRVEYEIQDLIDDVVKPNDWRLIIDAVAHKAKEGNFRAFNELAEFRFGKPKERVDLNVTKSIEEQVQEMRELLCDGETTPGS